VARHSSARRGFQPVSCQVDIVGTGTLGAFDGEHAVASMTVKIAAFMTF
jgi:hypothetical protein